ncbi:MAG: prenyltransferase [Bacteroidales bacterium]|jgi:1,4-dihydroxy-2-naphthoate octaprenyltransferase|nr:prenyltransferase [Bacteroidales bacterium]
MKIIFFWLKNARYHALPQSIMPAIVAISFALSKPNYNWLLAIVAFCGVAFAHLAMNLADDYFDYKVKSGETRKRLKHNGFRARISKYEYLLNGSTTLKGLLKAIIYFLICAAICGIFIMIERGIIIGLFAVSGLFFGIFYSAKPLKLSYRGLGEVVIGIMFGFLLMCGVYYAACGEINSIIILFSIPVGLLVTNIIFTHSILDRRADIEVSKMTFAILLKTKLNILIACFILNFCPFIIVCIGVITGIFNPLYLIVLVVLPRAIWLFNSLNHFLKDEKYEPQRHKWLGQMENWERIKSASIDWFMIRWYTSRNLTTAFCIIVVVINIVLMLWS